MRKHGLLPIVQVFFLADLSLALAYVLDYLAGHPYGGLSDLLNLDREHNLPTWYSSIQWFCIAVVLGLFAQRNFRLSRRGSWLLVLFPLVFLALSLDEVAQIHERLGHLSDKIFFHTNSRTDTVLPKTGIWMLAIGLPFLAFFAVLIHVTRPYFRATPGALAKIALGMAIMLTGAAGIETLSNFVTPGSIYDMLEVLAEETCELLGSTVILWGGCDLLAGHGFTVHINRIEGDD